MRKDRCRFENLEDRRLLAIDFIQGPGVVFDFPSFVKPIEDNDQILSAAYLDLDGDREEDLVYGTHNTKGVHVAFSGGNADFSQSQLYSLDTSIQLLKAGDLNQDGTLDLIAAGKSRIFALISQVEGDEFIGFQQTASIRRSAHSLSLGDIDDDGQLDLVVGHSQVHVYAGNGDGTFQDPITYTKPTQNRLVDLGDVDNDDDLDLIVASAGEVLVLKNDFGIFEQQADHIQQEFMISVATVSDINADGNVDLLVGDNEFESDTLVIFYGLGDGTFDRDALHYDILGTPMDFKFADINNDERIDIVVGHQGTFHHPINGNGPGGVSIFLANGQGGFESGIRIGTPDTPFVFLDDVDHDSDIDIVTVRYSSIATFRNQNHSFFRPAIDKFKTNTTSYLMDIGDLNGDSIQDIVLFQFVQGGQSYQLDLLIGTHDGDFHQSSTKVAEFLQGLFIGNFDEDEGVELVLVDNSTGRTSLLLTEWTNQNELAPFQRTRLGSSWQLQEPLDLNSDGILDFIGWDSSREQVNIAFGSAHGEFQPGNGIGPGDRYASPDYADFNHDGHIDLLLTGSEQFRVLINDGQGRFRQTKRQSFQYAETIVGDFNSDGNQDIIYKSFNSPTLKSLLGNGDGTFQRGDSFGPAQGSLFAADVNEDGTTDIVVAGYLETELILMNEGGEDRQILHFPHSSNAMFLLDLDLNGSKEIIFVPGANINLSQAQVSVVEIQGNEIIHSHTNSYSSTFLTSIPADMNNDGATDLVATSHDGFLIIFAESHTTGDVNGDGQINHLDVDLLCSQTRASNHSVDQLARMDLNGDDLINSADLDFLVEELLRTTTGDVNLDGVFNSRDLVTIFQIAEYEDNIANNSMWSEGDWNCDGEFTTADLVLAFQKGGYSQSAAALNSVDRIGAALSFDDPIRFRSVFHSKTE